MDKAGLGLLIINNRIKIVILVLLGSLTMGYQAAQLGTNNDIEIWLNRKDPQLSTYHDFIKRFGSEEFILTVIESKGGLTLEDIDLARRLSRRLEKIAGIDRVISPANFFPAGKMDFSLFRRLVLSDPTLKKTWISRDNRAWAIFIGIDPAMASSRKELVQQVRKVLNETLPTQKRYHLAGPPVFNVTLDTYSRKTTLIFSPLVFIISGIILWFSLPALSWAILGLLIALLVIINSLGCLAIFHHQLNMVTSSLPPLLMVISLSYVLHFFNACAQERDLMATISRVNRPIFLSSLTTSIGFASLATSDIGPIRDFGLTAAVGIVLAYLLVMGLLPASLYLLRLPLLRLPEVSTDRSFNQQFLQRIGDLNLKGGKVIMALGVIGLAISLYLARFTRIEVNALRFLKSDHTMVRDYGFIEEKLMGLSPLELVIHYPSGLPDREILSRIEKIETYLEGQPEVVNVFSLLDWIGLKERLLDRLSFLGGPFKEELGKEVKREMNRYYDPRGRNWRISCRVKTISSTEYKGLIQRIRAYWKQHSSPQEKMTITGIVPLLIDMQDTLLWSQMKSFLTAGLVISLALLLLVRSPKHFIIALIPNLWPISLLFGFMGALKIPLDVATVMVASIALGIAADNTIHFICRSRDELIKGHDTTSAMYNTLKGIGNAMILTSLVTIGGFMVLCLSPFKPMVYFGLLSSITLLAALLADLFLHPVLILAVKSTHHQGPRQTEG